MAAQGVPAGAGTLRPIHARPAAHARRYTPPAHRCNMVKVLIELVVVVAFVAAMALLFSLVGGGI